MKKHHLNVDKYFDEIIDRQNANYIYNEDPDFTDFIDEISKK